MKKLMFMAVATVAMVACGGPKQPTEVDVNELIASTEKFNGQTVKFEGTAKVIASDKLAVYGADTISSISVVTDSVCPSACGKKVIVTGVVSKDAEGAFFVTATSIEKSEACAAGEEENKECVATDSTATPEGEVVTTEAQPAAPAEAAK